MDAHPEMEFVPVLLRFSQKKKKKKKKKIFLPVAMVETVL
jgi:hypothetical protein